MFIGCPNKRANSQLLIFSPTGLNALCIAGHLSGNGLTTHLFPPIAMFTIPITIYWDGVEARAVFHVKNGCNSLNSIMARIGQYEK